MYSYYGNYDFIVLPIYTTKLKITHFCRDNLKAVIKIIIDRTIHNKTVI